MALMFVVSAASAADFCSRYPAGMGGSGLTIGELAAIKKIERGGHRVHLAKDEDGRWCCTVSSSHGWTCYRGATHSTAIEQASLGVHLEAFRRATGS